MKTILSIFSLVLLLSGCERMDNFGYPSKVNFGREGGIKVVSGNDIFHYLEVADYNGDGASSENSLDDDSLIVTYKWLTIKAKTRDNNLTIIAEPNPTGKSRKLYIYGDVTNQFAEIKVTQ